MKSKTSVLIRKMGWVLALAVPIASVGLARSANARIYNYDDNPHLEQALKYNGNYNGGDVQLSDRDKSAMYFRKYLDECTESFQRAKVYYELGRLYSTSIIREKGETKDYSRSVEYMQKALEEEPERIGMETIGARGYLVTPLLSREEKFEKRMAFYRWWLDAKAKAAEAERESVFFLPDVPDAPIRKSTWQKVTTFFEEADAPSTNLAELAASFPEPMVARAKLAHIVESFPETKAAEQAQRKLTDMEGKLNEEIARTSDVRRLLGNLALAVEDGSRETAAPAVDTPLRSSSTNEAKPKRASAGQQPAALYVATACIVFALVLLVAGGVRMVNSRRSGLNKGVHAPKTRP